LGGFDVFVTFNGDGAEEFWKAFIDGEDDGVILPEGPSDGGIWEAVSVEVGLDEKGGVIGAEGGGFALADVVEATGDGFFESLRGVGSQAYELESGRHEGADKSKDEGGDEGAHILADAD